MKKTLQLSIIFMGILHNTGCSLPLLEKGYNKELASTFPTDKGATATYFGLAEYGHKVTLSDIKKSKNKITYTVDGYIDDARGEDKSKRQFKISYAVTDKEITETITNSDEFRGVGKDNRINSIVPNQIILKTPIKVGTKWNQEFTYKNKQYTATTEITKIIKVGDDSTQYVTSLKVKNIDGFFGKEYTEERTYETGRGLVTFSNTMEKYDIDVDRELTKEDFMFGYTQGTFQK